MIRHINRIGIFGDGYSLGNRYVFVHKNIIDLSDPTFCIGQATWNASVKKNDLMISDLIAYLEKYQKPKKTKKILNILRTLGISMDSCLSDLMNICGNNSEISFYILNCYRANGIFLIPCLC